jgi:hypothetical protein
MQPFMTIDKFTPAYDFKLPAGYSIVRLQNMSLGEQEKLLPQIFDLIKEQYPEWPKDNNNNWLLALNGGNENGTKMAASLVLNLNNDVVGVSAMELYSNGTAMINYSIASKNVNDYLSLIYFATKDMAAGIQELQTLGETIHFVGKEHHLESSRAIAGYYAVGQVPIDGPTSLLTGEVKYYEVAYGNPKDVSDQEKIKKAFTLADPKTGSMQDEVIHLWLIRDFVPSEPNKPLAESLRALAEAYPKEHSIFRGKDYRLDPAYASLNELANNLPKFATYQQATQASAQGAAKYMGLQN